jgi:uncharacterized protein YbaR (Trm112 family)
MLKNLLEILACPICKTDLELKNIQEEDGEVVTGELLCLKCSNSYPIEDKIPILLPPEAKQ